MRISVELVASLIDGDIIDSKSAVGSPAFIHQFHFLTRNVCAVALQLHLAIIRSLLYVHVCISSTHNVCSVKLTQNSNRDEYFPAGRRATSIFLFFNIFQYFWKSSRKLSNMSSLKQKFNHWKAVPFSEPPTLSIMRTLN